MILTSSTLLMTVLMKIAVWKAIRNLFLKKPFAYSYKPVPTYLRINSIQGRELNSEKRRIFTVKGVRNVVLSKEHNSCMFKLDFYSTLDRFNGLISYFY